MKKLKAIIAISLLSLGFAFNTNAQTLASFRKMPLEQKAQLITDSLTATLNLSTNQSKSVYALALDGTQKAVTVFKSGTERSAKGKQMRLLLMDEEIKLKALLTPEQTTLYETKKKNLISYYRKRLKDQPILFNVPS